ncbi:MAG: hypothetical protein A2984_02455 [Omnitrophica WOR_2 bacterium RIFCSPLOWO2_01_FULL_41_12]|nr:MAG: hypothetical protein A2984_02455 [Omnitrophica WOR_2 bacterium RIFCSPLOWO2_01_FULL_41_12]
MSEQLLKKILVVDDEEEILTYLGNILKRAHYEFISTTKGKEVFDLAKSAKPDLIILDVLLPDLQGDEVAALLSQEPATSDIPIIFLTGVLITKEEEDLARKTGKHYLMAKPATEKEILEMVNAVLPR